MNKVLAILVKEVSIIKLGSREPMFKNLGISYMGFMHIRATQGKGIVDIIRDRDRGRDISESLVLVILVEYNYCSFFYCFKIISIFIFPLIISVLFKDA